MISRNKRSLSGTSTTGDIDEPRRKEPRLGFDGRLRDSNAEASSSTLPPVSSAQSFNTSNISGVVTNVGGHIINIVNLTNEEKAFAKEVCRWLAAPEPSRNYHAARETNHAHTGSWFICGNAFTRWKAAPDELLWLYGSPGCGKTIICSSVIEEMVRHCKEQPSSACAYFFFDSRNSESELSLHEKFVRSLILQLWHQLGRMPAALKDMYGDGPSHPEPSLAVLEAALQTIIGEFQHAYIIIDALDECADRRKLLRWLKDISCLRGGRLHMLLSSRRERDIEDSLIIINGLGRVSFAGGSANPDIVRFLDESLVELTRWDYEIRTLIRYTLLEGADGSFRWVALQLAELIQCSNLRSLKQQLHALPKDIEETYERLLLRACKRDDLRRFLQWMAFSERPIALEELAEVVTVDFQASDRPCYDRDLRYMDVRDVLTICSGFITQFEGMFEAFLAIQPH
ncbi:hypothetical protein FIBSPDRAFT_1049820 [Athelia psychrophila]|uniref:NACHT domain-containing protein n=1 Tax=Athelia psychrophila TaxID=1759441 RepID=A0A166BLI4_9AGAM|nr:hypothetical protein FIBSPDRAFT_1049820 [Fibularhizoctonia sp. CBS 109695]